METSLVPYIIDVFSIIMSSRVKRTVSLVDEIPKKRRSVQTKTGTKKFKSSFRSISSGQPKAVTMPYSMYTLHNHGAGVAMIQTVMRGNDVYDPEFVLGGHQAFGFDQMSPIYRKFYVMGSTIRVIAQAPRNQAENTLVMIWADTNATAPPSAETARERCLANHGVIKQLQSWYAGSNEIKLKAATKKMLSSGMTEDNNHGTDAQGPVEQWYWHVLTLSNDLINTPRATLNIDVLYDTIWTESKLNVGS